MGDVVDVDGTVCAVAFSGKAFTDQFLGSRVVSAQKAHTANAFSLNALALSTANLYAPTQPGGSLFGLQEALPGIDVSEDALSLEAIRETCLGGPNHFLGSTQTLARMQKEYLYPVLGDRSSPKEWEEKGRPALLDRASRKVADILATHFPAHVPRHIDEQIRARYPVRLAQHDMQPSMP